MKNKENKMADKNKKQNKKSEDKLTYILTILISIILIAGMVFGYFYTENKNKETEIAYTDLIKEISYGNIEKIEMTVGSTSVKVKVRDVEEEKTY